MTKKGGGIARGPRSRCGERERQYSWLVFKNPYKILFYLIKSTKAFEGKHQKEADTNSRRFLAQKK